MCRKKTDLREAARALALSRRPLEADHPDAETLAAYSEGALPAAEAERLQDHLADCAECARLMLDFAALPGLSEPCGPDESSEPDAEVAEAWERFRRRLQRP